MAHLYSFEVKYLPYDFLLFLIAFLYSGSVVFLAKWLKQKEKVTAYQARKIIHSFAALSLFLAPYGYNDIFPVLMALFLTLFTYFSRKRSRIDSLQELFDAIHEEKEERLGYLQGPFLFCLGIFVLMFIFLFIEGRIYIPIVAVVVMMYSDTLASIAGRKYGKHKVRILWVRKSRTVEGSIAFLLSAIPIGIISLFTIGYMWPGNNIPLSLSEVFLIGMFMALTSTLLELLSPSNYDDFIIPIGSTLLTMCLFFL